MNFLFTEEQLELQEMVREFVEKEIGFPITMILSLIHI